MNITCKSCEQPIEVDEGTDLSGTQCPSCGVHLATPHVPRSEKLQRLFSPKLTNFCAIAALALAIYCTYRLHKNSNLAFDFPDPVTAVRDHYRYKFEHKPYRADDVFWHAHRAEIFKTLEIVSTNAQADYMLVLVRFSVGDKVFREGYWVREYDKRWYLEHSVSTYKPVGVVAQHLDWFIHAEEKKEAWEKESAWPVR